MTYDTYSTGRANRGHTLTGGVDTFTGGGEHLGITLAGVT